jgi:hypothetical protein
MNERKKLFNIIQDLKGNIRVVCRVRPLGAGEKEDAIIVNKPLNKLRIYNDDLER